MSVIIGSKSEHAKALSALVTKRIAGASDDDMLAEMLALEDAFPGCGWKEAAGELNARLVDDQQAREKWHIKRTESDGQPRGEES